MGTIRFFKECRRAAQWREAFLFASSSSDARFNNDHSNPSRSKHLPFVTITANKKTQRMTEVHQSPCPMSHDHQEHGGVLLLPHGGGSIEKCYSKLTSPLFILTPTYFSFIFDLIRLVSLYSTCLPLSQRSSLARPT